MDYDDILDQDSEDFVDLEPNFLDDFTDFGEVKGISVTTGNSSTIITHRPFSLGDKATDFQESDDDDSWSDAEGSSSEGDRTWCVVQNRDNSLMRLTNEEDCSWFALQQTDKALMKLRDSGWSYGPKPRDKIFTKEILKAFKPLSANPFNPTVLLLDPERNKRILRRVQSDTFLVELKRCKKLVQLRNECFPVLFDPLDEYPPTITRSVDDYFKPPSVTYDPTPSPNILSATFILDPMGTHDWRNFIEIFDPLVHTKWTHCDRTIPIRSTNTIIKLKGRDINGRKLRRKHRTISGTTVFPDKTKQIKTQR